MPLMNGYIYNNPNSNTPYNNKKYSSRTLKTETITYSGNYIKIAFTTDRYADDYFGFKAIITPNYD